MLCVPYSEGHAASIMQAAAHLLAASRGNACILLGLRRQLPLLPWLRRLRHMCSCPAAAVQRDVPGLTRAVIPVLAAKGVKAVSVGVNPGEPHSLNTAPLWLSSGRVMESFIITASRACYCCEVTCMCRDWSAPSMSQSTCAAGTRMQPHGAVKSTCAARPMYAYAKTRRCVHRGPVHTLWLRCGAAALQALLLPVCRCSRLSYGGMRHPARSCWHSGGQVCTGHKFSIRASPAGSSKLAGPGCVSALPWPGAYIGLQHRATTQVMSRPSSCTVHVAFSRLHFASPRPPAGMHFIRQMPLASSPAQPTK